MTIATYDALKTAVADWLAREDLAARIPDFIALAEANINRDLRIAAMEKRATYETVAGDAFIAAPSDFLQPRDLSHTDAQGGRLSFGSPAFLREMRRDATGRPTRYSWIGGELFLAPAPDGPYTLELIYYGRFPALGADQPSNWLLENAPDAYLYGALLEAAPFIQDDERIATWKPLYDRAVDGLKRADRGQRWNAGPLVERAG